MIESHKQYLLSIKPTIDITSYHGTIIWIDDDTCIDIQLEDIYLYEFEYMYPNMILDLFEEGIEDIPMEVYTRLKNFLLNEKILKQTLSEDEFKKERGWINSIYGTFSLKSCIPGLIRSYLSLIYQDLKIRSSLQYESNNFIYIDTDMFFTKKQIKFESPLPIKMSKIPFAYFRDKRRYVYFNGEEIKYKSSYKKDDDLLNILKPSIRNYKIGKIQTN